MADRREAVRVLLLCTGKIAWELEGHELRAHAGDLAIGRVDLLDPLPLDEILELFRSYPNLEKAFWVQEEPENMGAWAHVQRRIGRHRPYEVSWEYIGRPRRASPSEGYHGSHVIEQERVLREALETSPAVQAHGRLGLRLASRAGTSPGPRRRRRPSSPRRAIPTATADPRARPASGSADEHPGRGPRRRPRRRRGRAARRPAGRRRGARGAGRAGRDLPQLGMHSHQITARHRRPAPAHPAGRRAGAQGGRGRGGLPPDDGAQGGGGHHHARRGGGRLQAAQGARGPRPGRARGGRGPGRRRAPRVRPPHRLRRHRAERAARHRHGPSPGGDAPTASSGWRSCPAGCW